MGIETLLTAMAYRAIEAGWAEEPCVPYTQEQKRISRTIKRIVKPNLVPSIANVYTLRSKDDVTSSVFRFDESIDADQLDYLSDASDVEDEELKQPKKRLGLRKFRKHVEHDMYSWLGSAEFSGIPIRAHVSGTTAMCLSAAEGLLMQGANKNVWFSSHDNLKALAGALLIPQFMRSDYHTFSETAAGVQHYLEQRDRKNGIDCKPTILSPVQAEFLAFECLSSGSSNDMQEGAGDITPREAIRKVGDHIESTLIEQSSYVTINTDYLREKLTKIVSEEKANEIRSCESLQEICFIVCCNRKENLLLDTPKSLKLLCKLLNTPEYSNLRRQIKPFGDKIEYRDIRSYALGQELNRGYFQNQQDKNNTKYFTFNNDKPNNPREMFFEFKGQQAPEKPISLE